MHLFRRMLSHSRNWLVVIPVVLAGLWIVAQEASTGQFSVESSAGGQVTVTYPIPEGWRMNPNLVQPGRSALTLTQVDAFGIETQVAVLVLSVAEADRAITALENNVSVQFVPETVSVAPQSFILADRDSAVTEGVVSGRQTLIVVTQVESGIFLVGQLVIASDGQTVESLRETVYALLSDTSATLPLPTATVTPSPLPQPTQPPQPCFYNVTLTVEQVRVINAEEAGAQTDFGDLGDQITLRVKIGPLGVNNRVAVADGSLYATTWQATLLSGQQIGDIWRVSRYACSPDFGFSLDLTEDDSTPFEQINTQLGDLVTLPLLQQGKPVEYRPSTAQTFFGETQDGNYEYQVVYSVAYESAGGLFLSDLTPSPTPSITPLPSATFTPTVTHTATPTFTPTASDTYTPSPTGTATNTPTATYTPSITYTPSVTYTPSITYTPSKTFTPSKTPTATATYTPSRTPTATPTATATYTPSNTPTPTATYTPSNTPTPTATSTVTLTPSNTPTPTPCVGSLPTRLTVGIEARVTPGDSGNRLRSIPNRNGDLLLTILPAEVFTVIGGAVCDGGFTWWQVDYQGVIGWTPEGDNETYWLEPLIDNPTPVSADSCIIIAIGIANQRNGPGTSFDMVGQLSSGQTREVIGQTTSTSGFIWFKLVDNTWVREDTVSLEGICSTIPQVSR